MKVAVVYYSMFNNTEYVANKIKEIIDCDLIRLYPVKEYPTKGLSKFFHGGKSAINNETPELKEYNFDADKYEYIIIGSPVWASRIAPPINTFIKDNKSKLMGKKIGGFITSAGGSEAALDRLEEALGKKIDIRLSLISPGSKQTEEKNKQIEEFIKGIE